MYRFLLSARWLGLAAVVIAVAAGCIRLGMWQFDRLDERQADNRVIEANLDAEPTPIDDVVDPSVVPDDDEWRPVSVTGTYDATHQIVVRNQTRDAGPGVSVLTPLRTSHGDVVLVERGWINTSSNPSHTPEPPTPPAGTVSVVGWLRADSNADDSATVPHDGTVRAIDSADIDAALPYDVRPGWVAMTEQQPSRDEQLAPPDEPDLGQGPHFFYGLQWWFFAGLALFGYGWFAWIEAHPRRPRQSVSRDQHPASSPSHS